MVGVSNTTVSVVLGDIPSPHVRVSESTRARILAAAQQMQYRPNRVARSLRYQKTNVIGIYTAYGHLNPTVPFTAQIIGGLHQGCDDHRKDLLLHGSYPNRSAEEIYNELADGRVDGLILYTWPEDPLVERLSTSHLPVVAIAVRDHVYEKTLNNVAQVKARGGILIGLGNDGDEAFANTADHSFSVPATNPHLTPLLTVLPLQLLAYHLADRRGCDVDQPRNLAKSVTVE